MKNPWLLFFLIIVLVAIIAYLTGIFVNEKHTTPIKITGSMESSDENIQDLDTNIMKYKQLMNSNIVADDDAVIELGERLIHQADTVNMKEEYLGEINEVKHNLLSKN